MKKLFDKIKAYCEICNTPLNGVNLYQWGDKFYCAEHYERESPQEKQANDDIEDEETIKRNFYGQY